MTRRLLPCLLLALTAAWLIPAPAGAAPAPVNFFEETGSLIDHADPLGDDKGPGFYQYPLDKRIRRGTYDLKRFSVYEEGPVVTFVIQTREYVMTEWPDTHKSEEQGFVTNVFDIYLDLDGRPGSGYRDALPGRELEFAEDMGWEKVILLTPLSQFRAYDILKDKTDSIDFQDRVGDVILPDYVSIQRDKIVLKISKDLIGHIGPNTGFQCLALGFSRVVSPNRMLNMDVRGFATPTSFGGGWDTYGDPPVMDLLMPEGQDQFEALRAYRSQPSRFDIVRAKIPFLFPNRKNTPAIPGIPDIPIRPAEPAVGVPGGSAEDVPTWRPRPTSPSVGVGTAPPARATPEPAPRVFAPATPVSSPRTGLRLPDPPTIADGRPGESADAGFVRMDKPLPTARTVRNPTPGAKKTASATGFLPLTKKKTTAPGTTAPGATAPGGFVPLKKLGDNP